MKKTTFAHYRQLVETHSQALRQALTALAAGDLDLDLEAPADLQPLADVFQELRLLVDTLRQKTAAQAQTQLALETAVAELRALQSRYIHREWTRYPGQPDAVPGYQLTEAGGEPTSSAWLPVMTTAVQQVKTATETDDAGQTTLALPLRLHGEVIGALGFVRAGHTTWTGEEIALVEAVTEHLSLALDEQRLFTQTQRALATTEQQARRLARLNEMSQHLSQARATHEPDLFQALARHLPQIIRADHLSLALLDPSGDTVTPWLLHRDAPAVPTEPLALTVGTPLEAAIRESRLIITPDTLTSEWQDAPEQAEQGIRSTMTVPLLVGTQVIGTLNIGSQEPHTYTQADNGIILQVASLLSATIENKRLAGERQRLATVVENHPDFIGLTTLQGQALYINPAGLKMMGLPPDHDVTAMRADDFYPPAQAQWLLQEGIPTALQQGFWASQTLLRQVDGTTVPVEQTLGINYDPHGHPLSVSLTMRDIRERQTAEAVLAKRAVELETVAQVSAVAATILEPDRLLQTVVDLAQEKFNLYHAHIYLLDESGNVLNLVAGAGEVGRQMVAEGWRIPLQREHSLVARAARARRGVIINDVHKSPDFLPNRLLPETRAEMAVPMIVGERLLGVLDLQASQIDYFTAEDVRIQTALAAQIAVAVQNARLAEQTQAALAETEDQARRLAALNELGATLSQTTQVDEIFNLATTKTLEIMPSDQANVALLNSASDTLDIVALAGQAGPIAKGTSLPVPGTDFESVIREKCLIVQQDNQQDAFLPDMRSRMSAPLIAGGRVIGVINVGSKKPNAYTTRDQNLFLQIASLLASGIESRRLFSRMQSALAETEALYNISAKLNATTTVEEILRAAISPAVERGATYANLFTLEVDAESRPVWLMLRATWEQQGPLSSPPTGGEEGGASGTRFSVADFPGSRLWLDNPYEPLLVGHISQDKRLDPAAQEAYRQVDAQATIILPLAVGKTWVGLMGIHWPTPQTFTGRDVRFYRSLASQAAVLVNNRLLFQQTQETLAETNALYEIGQALNTSSSTNEMLANLLNVLHQHNLALGANHITLTSIEVDQAGEPEWAENIAAQGPDGMEFSALVGVRYPLKTLAFTNLWTKDPSNPVIVSNAQTDKRLDEGTRAAYIQGGTLASATLPLSVGDPGGAGGRWVGLLTFGWPVPQTFPDRDIRIYRSLMRQVANFVESQRLFEHTQEALARAEATQRRYTLQAWEAYRTRNTAANHERLRTGVEPLGDRLPSAVTEAVRHKQTTVVEAPSGVTPPANSSLLVPLTLRDEVIGILGLEETGAARHWTSEEIALVEAVVAQMAEAAESLRLLDETQQRAAREARVNEIGEKIQGAQSLEEALQIAIKEVGLSLQAPQTTVQLNVK